MKALINDRTAQNAHQPRNKELVSTFNVVATIKGEVVDLVTARCYMGRSSNASVVYACLWVHGKDSNRFPEVTTIDLDGTKHTHPAQNTYVSGRGQAGGYGYHKESAAIADAIKSAGITLYGSPYADEAGNVYTYIDGKRTKVKQDYKRHAHIGGCGDTAVKAALMAIGRAVLPKGSRVKLAIITN